MDIRELERTWRILKRQATNSPTRDSKSQTSLPESQITEFVEAIFLPMNHKERFQKLGIRPPKWVLLYGPPRTGKTLMDRACIAQTNATFFKLAGPQLVQACPRLIERFKEREENVKMDLFNAFIELLCQNGNVRKGS